MACNNSFTENRNDEVLISDFIHPPDFAKPHVYWWWLQGSADTLRIREELNSFKNAGVSGVTIFDIGTPDHSDTRHIVEAGPAFMSSEYLENIAFAVEIAGELDIEVGLNLSSSWNAGGSWIAPEHAAKALYFSKTTISGPGSRQLLLPFPQIHEEDARGRTINIPFDEQSGRPVYNEEVAVIAVPVHESEIYPDTSRILNLTPDFDPEDEMLNWEVPEGEWEVYRYVISNSGRSLILPSEHSEGLILDHFDARSMEFHVNYFIDQLSTVIDDIPNSALTYLYLASYEMRGFAFTPALPDKFKSQHGYDIYKFLPSLNVHDAYVESAYEDEIAKRFLYDYNQTISDLMIINHYQKGSEVANSSGLKLVSESGGPGLPLHNVPVEALGALGAVDVPRGEFWYEHSRFTQEGISFARTDSIDLLRMVKGPAAAGNIYKREIVEMEAFTSWHHWETGPFDIKPVGDRAFTEGMNRVVVHGASHNPVETGFPGIAYHAGTHYNDKLVAWPKLRPFNNYLARISYMLRQGSFFSDVIYYHGDQAPNIVRPKNADFSVAPGYDYEVINTEILLRDLVIENGLLKIPEVGTYRILVMNPSERVNPLVLEKLGSLARQGAIIIGEKPSSQSGLGYRDWDPDRIEKEISDNWQSFPIPTLLSIEDLSSGKILDGVTVADVLEILQIPPDLKYSGQTFEGPLDYIHYQTENLDYYFIRNTTKEWVTKEVFFRQQDKVPELWDPVNGKHFSLPVYRTPEKQIGIPLSFKPYDAYFIVFKEGKEDPEWNEILNTEKKIPAFEYTSEGILPRETGSFLFKSGDDQQEIAISGHSTPLEGKWHVMFPENRGAPSSSIFTDLISWTEAKEEGIKYFSGIATYQKTFDLSFDPDTLSKEVRIYLNLGELEKVGEAWLNDVPLGITWTKPHEYDVTEYLKPGVNEVRLEIANVWANRIIGDARTGQNFTTTNITQVRGLPWKEVPLVPSGLLGPVTIQLRTLVTLEN
ncbi:MAG: glycosyl hydrolase [Balneolales bacterium]